MLTFFTRHSAEQDLQNLVATVEAVCSQEEFNSIAYYTTDLFCLCERLHPGRSMSAVIGREGMMTLASLQRVHSRHWATMSLDQVAIIRASHTQLKKKIRSS